MSSQPPRPRRRKVTDTRGDIASLQHTVDALQRTVMLIAEVNAVPNILVNSFEELSVRLLPLANLSPSHEPMDRHSLDLLRRLRRDLARPKWTPIGAAAPGADLPFAPNPGRVDP